VWGREAVGEIKIFYCLWQLAPYKLYFKQNYRDYIPSKFEQSSPSGKMPQEKSPALPPGCREDEGSRPFHRNFDTKSAKPHKH
jgi:hypothetical protein